MKTNILFQIYSKRFTNLSILLLFSHFNRLFCVAYLLLNDYTLSSAKLEVEVDILILEIQIDCFLFSTYL